MVHGHPSTSEGLLINNAWGVLAQHELQRFQGGFPINDAIPTAPPSRAGRRVSSDPEMGYKSAVKELLHENGFNGKSWKIQQTGGLSL